MNQELINVPYADFVAALAKPGAAIVDSMTPVKAHMLHMAVGIAGEAAELLAAAVDSSYLGKALDRENMIEELGDVEFYTEGLVQAAQLNVAAVKGLARPMRLEVHAALVSVIAGDLLDVVKKHVIYGKPLDQNALSGKVATLHYEMDCLRMVLGVSREAVILANKQKLGKRYSSGSYSDTQAQARADKAEGQ